MQRDTGGQTRGLAGREFDLHSNEIAATATTLINPFVDAIAGDEAF